MAHDSSRKAQLRRFRSIPNSRYRLSAEEFRGGRRERDPAQNQHPQRQIGEYSDRRRRSWRAWLRPATHRSIPTIRLR